MKAISLYIHVPFCKSKCSYCTFYSCVDHHQNDEEKYLENLLVEIDYYMDLTESDSFRTIYIGGGSPSVLSEKSLNKLFNHLKKNIKNDKIEITMECNPEDLTRDLLDLLIKSPVNRISLGVQSFNDDVLSKSGRKTTRKSINKALELLENNWNHRFSMDIISGLPGQTMEYQQEDMRLALETSIDHLSLYTLIVEENSDFSRNEHLLQDQDLEDDMWILCKNMLEEKGFNQYEVSNYAKATMESEHNKQYWYMNDFIACGPGGVGMIKNKGIQRISNPHSLKAYCQGLKSNWSSKIETISPQIFLFENYMMGLRLKKGINRTFFYKRFNELPENFIRKTIEKSKISKFIIKNDHLSLNEESYPFLNTILMDIYDEIQQLNFKSPINWP